MTRTSVSTLKIRAVFTAFVAVVLLTLFAIIPRMVTGFSNYLESGDSIFFSFMEPVNILWFLPANLQVISITLQQFLDICVFALISNHIWAFCFHYYMKIKQNIAFQGQMTGQNTTESFVQSGSNPFLIMGSSNHFSARFDLAQKPSIGVSHKENPEFPQNCVDGQRKPPVDPCYDTTQQPDLCILSLARLKRTYSSISLANSVHNSPGFDFFILTPPVCDPALNFSESLSSEIGGNS